MIDTGQIMDSLTNLALDYGPKLLGAIAVWIIGGWVIKIIKSFFKNDVKK